MIFPHIVIKFNGHATSLFHVVLKLIIYKDFVLHFYRMILILLSNMIFELRSKGFADKLYTEQHPHRLKYRVQLNNF